jgi:hypothetical protein
MCESGQSSAPACPAVAAANVVDPSAATAVAAANAIAVATATALDVSASSGDNAVEHSATANSNGTHAELAEDSEEIKVNA